MLINVIGVFIASLLEVITFGVLAYFYSSMFALYIAVVFLCINPVLLLCLISKHRKLKFERATVNFEK